MTAFNVVRVRAKPGREPAFLDASRGPRAEFAGARRFVVIKRAAWRRRR